MGGVKGVTLMAGKPTYEELADLVQRQARMIEELQARVRELEEQLRAAHRQVAPFRRRSTQKKKPEEKKKPGRKPGHEGEYRRPPEVVDRSEEVPLEGCPHCHGPLRDVAPHEQIIEELPPVEPVRIRVTTYSGMCAKCGVVHSRHPLQTSTACGAAGTQLGPRAQALAVSLSHQSGLSMRHTCRVLKTLCGLRLSPGGLAQLLQRTAGKLKDWYQAICDRIAGSAAVFADETSWYVGEPGWWLWVFTSPTATVYRIEHSRGSNVVLETLGDDFSGMLISDCLASYNLIAYRKHKCIAHHLKALSEHRQALEQRGLPSDYLTLWKLHLQDVIDTWHNRDRLTASQWEQKVEQLQRGVDRLLSRSPPEGEEVRFRDRLRKQHEHLLGCLSEPAAEPTNNRAERDLRPAVINRKLSCGNRTVPGKHAWEILRSIVVTADKRKQDVVSEIATRLRIA